MGRISDDLKESICGILTPARSQDSQRLLALASPLLRHRLKTSSESGFITPLTTFFYICLFFFLVPNYVRSKLREERFILAESTMHQGGSGTEEGVADIAGKQDAWSFLGRSSDQEQEWTLHCKPCHSSKQLPPNS